MKIHILAVGNKMPAWVSEGFNEYVRRMPGETAIRLVEIKPEKRAGKDIDKLLNIESERIQTALPSGCHVVVMDEHGQQTTTLRLAQMLTGWLASGRDYWWCGWSAFDYSAVGASAVGAVCDDVAAWIGACVACRAVVSGNDGKSATSLSSCLSLMATSKNPNFVTMLYRK